MARKDPKNAEYQRAWRQRSKEAAGGPEVRGIYAHPDDHPPIKAYAAEISAKRTKQQKKP
jgi:hypothetical protein